MMWGDLSGAIGVDLPANGHAIERLEVFEALVLKWNPTINVIARSTEATVRIRHILDSAQIFRYMPAGDQRISDLGSGGGFPGLVLAILAADLRPDWRISLIESDKRKAVFLREVIRQTGISASVLNGRIEELPQRSADIVTARALAPLDVLCGHAHSVLSKNGVAVFLKGVLAAKEIESARRRWHFALDQHPSITDRDASVLVVKDLELV